MNQPRTSPITRALLSVCQAGGMGHILNWGVRKRSEPFTGEACFPELSCCLLTTCQAQPHSAHWENRPSLEGKGLQDSAIQGSEGLTTITWPPIPKRAGQKLHTSHRHTHSVIHSCQIHPNTHLDLDSLPLYIYPHHPRLCVLQRQGLSALVIIESSVSGTQEVCSIYKY